MKSIRKNNIRGRELPQRSMFTKQPAESGIAYTLDWTARLEKKKNVAKFINQLFTPEWNLTHGAIYSTARMSNHTFARIIDSDNTHEIPTEYTYCRLAAAVLSLYPDLCPQLAKQRLLNKGSLPHGVAELSEAEEAKLKKGFVAAFGTYGECLAKSVRRYEDLQKLLDRFYREADTRNRNKHPSQQAHKKSE